MPFTALDNFLSRLFLLESSGFSILMLTKNTYIRVIFYAQIPFVQVAMDRTMSEMVKYKGSVLLKRPQSSPVYHHLWHSPWLFELTVFHQDLLGPWQSLGLIHNQFCSPLFNPYQVWCLKKINILIHLIISIWLGKS